MDAGGVNAESDGLPNELYYGDNIDVLRHLIGLGRGGTIKMVYIDPPFATKSVFECRDRTPAYEDLRVGAQYVEFVRKRLVLLRRLLSDDGSIYVHLDSTMVFHIKVIMDEVFGEKNFRGMITRKKCSNKNYTKRTYGDVADYILFYSKTERYVWNRPYTEWTEEKTMEQYPCQDEEGRRYKRVPLHAPGVRNGETGKDWRGMSPPPGKHWQYPPSKLEELDRNGEIYWSKNGNPRRIVYFDDNRQGISVQNIWTGYQDSKNQNDRVTGYPTEKNLDLLKQIVQASTDEGDVVLDCFCGSGSTLEAAFRLNRRWIGADNSMEAVKSTVGRFTLGVGRHGAEDATEQPSSDGKCPFALLSSRTDAIRIAEEFRGVLIKKDGATAVDDVEREIKPSNASEKDASTSV
ncbi:MAG: site-specific DNA-methyltransferase [Candidatus Methanoplasma sp.]|nr:site-specific DNA-methyltransferase [Candidatus Methanoplasma sp.]